MERRGSQSPASPIGERNLQRFDLEELMTDELREEIYFTVVLKALADADPRLLRDILAETQSKSPNYDKILAQLKKFNDRQHGKLKDMAGIDAKQPQGGKQSRAQRVNQLLEEGQ
jgi:hypothetical protein